MQVGGVKQVPCTACLQLYRQ